MDDAVGKLVANRTTVVHRVQRPIQNFITYTKNILITFDNTKEYVINSESDIIQIDAKQYSEICFSSNDGNIATTTFQILDGTEQTSTQDMQMPLYRGMPKKAKLLKGQIAYYRLYFYPI